jgi:hypothetical protein
MRFSNNNEKNDDSIFESNDLKKINERLGCYINAVQELTTPTSTLTTSTLTTTTTANNNNNNNTKYNNDFKLYPHHQVTSNNQQQQQHHLSSFKNSNLNKQLSKNISNDIESLINIYEDEIKSTRKEIEQLSSLKNKYALENYNLELKIKDYIIK